MRDLTAAEAEEFYYKGYTASFIAGRNMSGFTQNLAGQLARVMRENEELKIRVTSLEMIG